jgi:hypothetical protein
MMVRIGQMDLIGSFIVAVVMPSPFRVHARPGAVDFGSGEGARREENFVPGPVYVVRGDRHPMCLDHCRSYRSGARLVAVVRS